MDLETGRVVDLLPTRTVASFETWLREHPGVEVIARDRSVLFADGGRRGARAAAQIHDRAHLVSNLYEAALSDVHHVQVEAQIDCAAEPPVRAEFLQMYPGARALHGLLLRFRALLRWRSPELLEPWIAAAVASPFPFTRRLAQLLEQDLAAVKLSISAPWSNGPLEGQINRLKAIKRQMYGRAGFDLVKARVLLLDLEAAA